MPITPTYPGVYIEEIPSGVRTITPVATSITAFVGSAPRGPAEPTRVQSIAEFERNFGGLDGKHPMTYAVTHYFAHGGSDAIIVRVTSASSVAARLDAGGIPLQAESRGVWGNNLRAHIDLRTKDRESREPKLFNLFLYDDGSKATEEF